MRYPKNLTFVLVALLVGSFAFAAPETTESLISAYVPVLAGQTEEIAIRELVFLTWGAMPESRIQAVLWPYKVNSPHKESDGKNINPASMVNLRISPVLYPASSCVVTIDVGDMTEAPAELTKVYGPVSKKDLIMTIIEVTGRNLRASKISECGLIVEGAEIHEELKGLMFPTRFDRR